MFKFFESRIGDISTPPDASSSGPPPGLVAFYWHFVRQTKGLYLTMLVTGLGVALVDTVIPVFIGRLVGLMTSANPALALQQQLPLLLAMGLALLVGALQFSSFGQMIPVLIVFGIGQLLESNYITPKLVGERIGLHPVVVIFALLAGGQLFGFAGVLLALPVSATIAVLLLHAKDNYLDSDTYLK